MEIKKIKWNQDERKGEMILKWWIERGKVRVELDGDIPHVMGFEGEHPSREASKGAYELLYGATIRKWLNGKGHDYK